MKKILLILVCFNAFWAASMAQNKELIDKVVAKVGDEYILLSDVEEQFAAAKDQKSDLPANYRCLILDNVMVNKLLLHQAKLDSLYPKDDEVETQLNARFERILDYMGGNTDQFLAYYGQSPDAMKEQMREDMRDQIMTDKMKNKVIGEVTVTPAEVRDFFDRIPKDSLPYFNQEVEISEITLRPKVNEQEKERARTFLAKLRQEIVSGTIPFENHAKKYSMDPGSGAQGGDLGWAKRGKFVPEFEAQAYKLEQGEISEVFETEFGFHILQLLERRGNSVHARHILIKPEITYDDRKLAESKLDSIRLLVLKDSITFSYAVKQFGDKNTQSFHNDGRVTNPNSGNNIFETRDLDPDTYFAIDTMKVNSICAPMEMTDPSGEKYYRIVRLNSKTAPHKANLLQDYNKIQAATLEQKKNQALISWIERKAKVTFVLIDPIYKNCGNLDKWSKAKMRP